MFGSIYPFDTMFCDLHMQCGSHICSVIYADIEAMLYIELMFQIELYIDSCLPFYISLDNMLMYTNVCSNHIMVM